MTQGLAEEEGRFFSFSDHQGERQEAPPRPVVHATATVRGSRLGPFTEIGAGTGAIVGAGAVVTESVLPFTIVAGVPARLLRRRFDKATAEGLLEIVWWDWPHEELKEALDDFRALDAQAFVEKYRSSHGGRRAERSFAS